MHILPACYLKAWAMAIHPYEEWLPLHCVRILLADYLNARACILEAWWLMRGVLHQRTLGNVGACQQQNFDRMSNHVCCLHISQLLNLLNLKFWSFYPLNQHSCQVFVAMAWSRTPT